MPARRNTRTSSSNISSSNSSIRNDQQHYQNQKDRYWDERADYNYDRTHPATWWHDHYEHASLNRFYDIPRSELVDLRVASEDGFTVGRIREVDKHDDGRVAAVQGRVPRRRNRLGQGARTCAMTPTIGSFSRISACTICARWPVTAKSNIASPGPRSYIWNAGQVVAPRYCRR